MELEVHSKDSAPEPARDLLEQAEHGYGFVPNILGVMANSPALLEGYMTLNQIFEKTSLSTAEKQIVLLGAATENECHYCTAAHLAIAKRQNVDGPVLKAVANGETLPDDRLDALFRFTRVMVRERGHPSDDDLRSFLDAGFSQFQVQEVVLGIGLKTLSNYNNHVAETPIDEQFKS